MFPNDFAPRVGHRFTFQVPPNPQANFDGLTVHCYIYSPFENIPEYAVPTRFGSVPVLVLTGFWMWKGQAVRRLFSKASADALRRVTIRAIERRPGVNTMAKKKSKKSAKVAKKAATKRVAAKAAKPRKTAAKSSPSHRPARPRSRSSSPAATRKSPRPTATPPCRPTSRPCRAGNSDVGRRLDALITRTVPDVCKAVRWNTPFYGVEGQGWFLGFHCITKYIKVAFFRGTSLRPVPPGRVQAKGRALLPHPRGRPVRRSPIRRLGEAGQPTARRKTLLNHAPRTPPTPRRSAQSVS